MMTTKPLTGPFVEADPSSRHDGIGASEAPVIILGKHFVTPADLYLEKLGLADHVEPAEHMEIGNRLEPAVIEMLNNEMADGTVFKGQRDRWRSTAWPFMTATPDAICQSDGGMLLAQVKTTGNISRWADGVPRPVWIQLQHEMAVMGAERAAAAALGGGSRGPLRFLWDWVERNDEFIENTLVPALKRFWHSVVEEAGPPVDASENCRKALKKLWPESEPGKVVELPGDFIELEGELTQIKAQIKELESRKRKIENMVCARLKDAEMGRLPNGVTCTYRTQWEFHKPREAKSISKRVLRWNHPD